MSRNSPFNKLRFKITSGILLILTLILLPLGYFFITGQRTQMMMNLTEQGESLAHLVARASVTPIEKFSFFRLEELALEVEQYGQVAFCEIYGSDGLSLVSAEKIVSQNHNEKQTRQTGSHILLIEKTIQSENEVIEKVEIGLFLNQVYDRIQRRTVYLVIVLVSALGLVALCINLFLNALFVSPVVHLSTATRSLAEGKFVTIGLSNRNDEIGDLAKSFNKMSISLEQLYNRLEEKVKERTRDLAKINTDLEEANKRLKKEMEDRLKSERDRLELEFKLNQAQKMEAIGKLAGGVAHDLNNILSGLVSYPELMLLDLPEESPLRKPIMTIKKSGEKAARIVQDLLTLSRRGVTTTEVVNLNAIIEEYLKSPEFEQLKTYHLQVEVECSLEKKLLNVLGSSVHLSKTIMNLVVNSAEAMPLGGTIHIATDNRYIDRPVSGYDNVTEGDYVVVSVSDCGVGIPDEDIERIFEPFYTKKTMGRSGTGLGMAVVWGTVSDHNGYIEIDSEVGKGTTIRIYIPVTRLEKSQKAESVRLNDIKGNRETVLVVDDITEQREIATGILKKLDYQVKVCTNGEEAIRYIGEHHVDLLVLDMIMEPGIDGLETYRRILEVKKSQKAVIASGFSETERVKTALELGAGTYVQKPYTLETLGLAVQSELKKK